MSGYTITLSYPLGSAHPDGAIVVATNEFIPGIFVFDKLGYLIGTITEYAISQAPSREVSAAGGMQFFVPKTSADVSLLAEDRLVAVQSELGDELWAGTITTIDASSGMLQAQCDDVLALWSDGVPLTIDQEIPDNTPATAVYRMVLNAFNANRSLTSEVQWLSDYQGSKPFFGDFALDGSASDGAEGIAHRSSTEFSYHAAIVVEGDGRRRLELTHVVRDRFEFPGGGAIFDGPGGNITSEPRITRDATPIVNYIRLRGSATDLSKYLPDWAIWASHDVTPEVVVSVDPGPYRRRADLNVTVDWSLSKAAQRSLANQTVDIVWEMYASYLRAIHDMEGRPFHEGWKFAGPPDGMEPKSAGKDSFSRRAWKTRLQLLETTPNHPVSGVMVSDSRSQINYREWLVVDYNRVTAVQTVQTYAIPLAAGLNLIKWNVRNPGSATGYRVSGGRIVSSTPGQFVNGTGAFVAPYSVRIWWPAQRRYKTLRQIIAGPFALKTWIDPSDHDNLFVDLGPDAALDSTDSSGASLIGTVYTFERYQIKNWDPRRDGVGQQLTLPTAWNGGVTTRPRWHVVSFDVGADANTQLLNGVSATETQIEVMSVLGFPDNAPFVITVNEDEEAEDMLVTVMAGAEWTIVRAQNGTTAKIHETGATVRRQGAAPFQGFTLPYDWPEGQVYAQALLAKLSIPRVTFNFHVTNDNDLWSTIRLGSIHNLNIQSEGPSGGYVQQVRVIGYSPDWDAGTMECVFETLTPDYVFTTSSAPSPDIPFDLVATLGDGYVRLDWG